MNFSKVVDRSKDYVMDAVDAAQDFFPSAHDISKAKHRADMRIARSVAKSMPAEVKRMEVAKLILLPLAGAAVALLFAPKSGKELRKDLKESFLDVKETSMEKAHEWKEAGMEKAQYVKDVTTEKAQEWKEAGEKTADEFAHKADDLKHDLADKADDVKRDLADKADDVNDDIQKNVK